MIWIPSCSRAAKSTVCECGVFSLTSSNLYLFPLGQARKISRQDLASILLPNGAGFAAPADLMVSKDLSAFGVS